MSDGRTAVFVRRAMRTRRELRGEGRFRYVGRISRQEHLERMGREWELGEHVSIFGATRSGKSQLALDLAGLFQPDFPWLLIDCKGDDPTLARWGQAVRSLPPRILRNRSEDQRWRLVVPRTLTAIPKSRETVRKAVTTARAERNWVIHLNEARALTDPKAPGLGLGAELEQLWMRGAPHVTVIAETQRPAWVPGSMYDQSFHTYVGGILDERSRKRLAEIGGDLDNLLRALKLLERWEFLYVRRLDGHMEIVEAD